MPDEDASYLRDLAEEASVLWFCGAQPKNAEFLSAMILDLLQKAIEWDRGRETR